ncbi:PREDICTED: uncharacterized protein LOC109182638 [Ipomoea nil]|uniref:uncharacterized protein LOC109182638 n=1 Tax=Ipomoea nil TaxID=35883 RepID=UPI00090170B0|nr:PREDICTED: uncharacterized protein LOC109182638 [Ipomoea nil]
MDSLLATNYASSDEEEESQQRNHQPSNFAPLGNSDDDDHILSVANKPSSVFSLPPPKSSSSMLSSLPAPKAFRADPLNLPTPFASSEPKPKKDSIVDDDDDEEKEKRRKGSEPALQALSVESFLLSLPVPKNSGTLGALPLGSGTSRRSILEANVPASSDSNEAQSVKSFLSSLPVRKSSGTLGALPLGSGTSRRSILEANVPAASNEAQSVQGSTVRSSGGYQSEYVDHVGGYQQWGTEGESYPNYRGYTGYGNGDGQYSNWVGPNGEQYSNYASGCGDYGQFEHNWVDGSNASSQELPGAAESALRLTGKCGRNDATQQIVEVKLDELMKNRPGEDQVRLTGIAFGPSYKVRVSYANKLLDFHNGYN